MATEKEWVRSFSEELERRLQVVSGKQSTVRVHVARRLPYSLEIDSYVDAEPERNQPSRYETDILICDEQEQNRWIPRVVVECKQGAVTTHDALTYSAKAATHKSLHPYLRYGILIGNWGNYALPARLFRHGANFDFMTTWRAAEATDGEWEQLMDVLILEVKASRTLQEMLTSNRSGEKKRYSMIHKPLKFEERP